MKKFVLILIVGAALAALWFWRARPTQPAWRLPLLTERLMQAGLNAAKEKNWPEAIASFRHAHTCSPRQPGPLHNLALAHDQAGHRMVALCWYEALLAIAPDGKHRAFAQTRTRELDSMIQADITKLARTALEIATVEAEAARETAPTSAELHRLKHVRTAAMVEGLLGDVARATQLLDELRPVNPADGFWSETRNVFWSDAGLQVGCLFAERRRFEEAEQVAGRFPPPHAAVIREHIAQVKESGLDSGSGSWMKDLNPAEIVHHWSTYADEIVAGTHHQRHVMDLFAVDPVAKQDAAPEMGVGPYLEALRWRTSPPGASDVMDGVKRLCLTYREIKNWRNQ